MQRLRFALAAAALVGSSGCAESDQPRAHFAASSTKAPMVAGFRAAEAPAPGVDPAEGAAPVAAPDRKIIYNAAVDLVVEDFSPVADAVTRLVEDHRGYIAEMELSGSAGNARQGHWKVRVPVAQFDTFLSGIVKLGIPTRNRRDSQDVSDKFYDSEARIKNKKVEEARLVKLLEEVGGKLEEILTVEKELSRVRGEIEAMEGTLRVLSNLTSLTTVTLTIQEKKDYVPPEPPAPPTFATMIARTFYESLDHLIRFGKALILAFVAIAPWLPLILVGVGFAWWISRRLGRVAPAQPRR